MKKFAKLLFSRMTIVGLAIIAQVAFWVILYYSLSKNAYISTAVNIIIDILAILFLFIVINKNQQEVFKLPWVIIILVFPLFGIVIFTLFGRSPLSKKQIKHRRKIKEEIARKVKSDDKAIANLKNENLEAYGQSCYLTNVTSLPLCENTKTEYLSSGKNFYNKMLKILSKAEKYIMLEYFIVGEGKMLDGILDILYEKVNKNVEVFLLFDDIGSLGRMSAKKHLEIKKRGIKIVVFNPFVPITSVIHNNRDHRKITVVDGKYGLVGGINIGDEYIDIDHPYGYWKDSAIFIEGNGVDSLVSIFAQNYNIASKNHHIDIDNYLVKHEKIDSTGYLLPFGDGPAPIDMNHIGEDVFSNLIGCAKKSICITTPYLIVSYEFLHKLCLASKRGVEVKIITPYIPDKKVTNILTKSNYQMLIESGVKIYEFKPGFIHAKNFIVDDIYGVCGTINVDYRSFVHHYECGIWMYKCEAIKQMKDDFDQMIENQTIFIDENKAKLSLFKRMIKAVINLFAPLF